MLYCVYDILYNQLSIIIYHMKKSNNLEQNLFYVNSQNQLTLQQSVRLLQYINMYNLKKDQIIYQCPILISAIQEDDFNIEAQCLEQMADLQIIYKNQRKKQIKRVRIQQSKFIQKKLQEQKRAEEEQKKKRGFFGSLFSSKSKDKNQIKSPVKKQQLPKIDENLIKSSIYLKKGTSNQNITKSQIVNHNKISNIKSLKQKNDQQGFKKKQPGANPLIKVSQKTPNKNSEVKDQSKFSFSSHFNQQQLIDFDEDQLQSLKESVKKVKTNIQMSYIKQQNQQDQSICKPFQDSQIRDSKVSRIYRQMESSVSDRKNTGRMSKRNKKLIDQSDQQQKNSKLKASQQIKMMKKPSNSHTKSPQFKKISKIKLNKDNVQQQNKNDKIYYDYTKFSKNKQPKIQNEKKNKNHKMKQSSQVYSQLYEKSKSKQLSSDILSNYISKQISRLSYIGSSDLLDQSSVQLINGISKIQASLLTSKVQRQQQKKQDSFSDVKIDWLVKMQACELEEALLTNRIKQRWSKPMKSLVQLKNLKLDDFTKDINSPRYMWTRPNLNFGKIIQ